MADMTTLTLKDVFQQGYSTFKKIETDESSINSDQFQNNVSEATKCFRTAIEKVNELALFSTNEDLDDIPTNNLRYLILPALLGELALKSNIGERIDVVKISKIYLLDFLERCKMYSLLQEDMQLRQMSPETGTGSQRSLENLALERQAKITRYKKLKQQEKQLEDLSKLLQDPSVLSHDEELERKYNILLLENWINKALENISSINHELQILEHIEKMKQQGEIKRKPNKDTGDANSKTEQFLAKPILITREAIKNKVFGAGYPSLPTMTQEECFEKELREGKIVAEFQDKLTTKTESDDDLEDKDDESCEDEKYLQKLKKERDWDDWKDDNRRGWGNRENMG